MLSREVHSRPSFNGPWAAPASSAAGSTRAAAGCASRGCLSPRTSARRPWRTGAGPPRDPRRGSRAFPPSSQPCSASARPRSACVCRLRPSMRCASAANSGMSGCRTPSSCGSRTSKTSSAELAGKPQRARAARLPLGAVQGRTNRASVAEARAGGPSRRAGVGRTRLAEGLGGGGDPSEGRAVPGRWSGRGESRTSDGAQQKSSWGGEVAGAMGRVFRCSP